MKKSVVAIGLILGAACALTAFGMVTGNGNVISEHRDVRGFSGVSVSGAATVFIERGEAYSCVVTLDSNLQKFFQSKVTRGVLDLGFKPGAGVRRFKKLEIHITMPELRRIEASGASKLDVEKGFSGRELSVELSGASKLNAAASYSMLGLKASGASRVDLGGKYGDIAIVISGASTFKGSGSALGLSGEVTGASRVDFSECALEDSDILASGASTVRLSEVTKKIRAKLSGASTLHYEGDPEIEQDCSGGSSLKKSN